MKYWLLCLLLLSGCASFPQDEADHDQFVFEEPFLPEFKKDQKDKPKSIFVFIDETGNNRKVPTNVYRTFQELVNHNNDKHTVAMYIEGTGNNDTPPKVDPFGFGLDDRIAQGYRFILQQHRPKDKLYLFGFGRGAEAARALAGMLAYVGVLKVSDEERKDKDVLLNISKELLAQTKSVRDSSYEQFWQNWQTGDELPLADSLHNDSINDKTERAVDIPNIQFLGLWDTVAATSNNNGIISFIMGEPYKLGSYPVITHVAHAVSLDEKRKLFKPILLSSALNEQKTQVTEALFSGSHADVGGGYEDDKELANISLNWMLGLLSQHYSFSRTTKFSEKYKENAQGLAHLSMSEFEGNQDSDCQDRALPDTLNKHPSVETRNKAGLVPVRVCLGMKSGMDGKTCKRNSNVDGIYQIEKIPTANIYCDYIKRQQWFDD